ncbi:MAG: branched-chain amino acid ABC transporter substrate-binding protein [Thermodesulfobacteriota bacterium]
MSPVKGNKVLFAVLLLLAGVFSISCTEQEEPSFQCQDPLGCVDISPDEAIKIGVLQALSGKVAPLGEAQIKGLELALDKRDNQIFGHSIVLQIEDTGCTAEGGANGALKLIADPKTVAIFGSTCSGAAATASKAMSAAGLSMVSGNNSAPFLTSIAGQAAPNHQPGYFRTSSNEENAGKAAAGYVYGKLGLRRAATIHDSDIYTRGLVDSFTRAFRELGGEVVLESAVNKGDSDMLPVLTAVAGSGAQLLFFPLFQPEGNHIVLQARKMETFAEILLISDGALIEQSFIEAVGDDGKGMLFVGPRRPEGEAVDRLAALYGKKYGEPPAVSYYLTGFDAADILLSGIEKAAIREDDGSLHIGRKGLRDVLYGTSDHDGVSGTLSCDRFGDCGVAAFNVLGLADPSLGVKGLEANVIYSWNSGTLF